MTIQDVIDHRGSGLYVDMALGEIAERPDWETRFRRLPADWEEEANRIVASVPRDERNKIEIDLFGFLIPSLKDDLRDISNRKRLYAYYAAERVGQAV